MCNVESLEDINSLYKRIIYTTDRDKEFYHSANRFDTLIYDAVKAGDVIRFFHNMLDNKMLVGSSEDSPIVATKCNNPMKLYLHEEQFQEISVKNIDGYLKKLENRISHECYMKLRGECNELVQNYSYKPKNVSLPNEYYPAFRLDCEVQCSISPITLTRRLLYNPYDAKGSYVYEYYGKPICVWEVEVCTQYKISMT